jgi:hypothetical protein
LMACEKKSLVITGGPSGKLLITQKPKIEFKHEPH